ncbi:MAG: hypothetical protein ACFFDN_30785, partial [Candidatus Hodarchaeota archaeon]
LTEFENNDYEPPIAILDGINFGRGHFLDANYHIQKLGTEIIDIKSSITFLNFAILHSILSSNGRLFDNEMIVFKSSYIVQPTKATISQDGISSSQETELNHDTFSAEVASIFLEVARGVKKIHELRDFKFSLVASPSNQDVNSLLERVVEKTIEKQNFKEYGNKGKLKMPSGVTYFSRIIENINVKLKGKLENVQSKQEAIKAVQYFLKNNGEWLEEIFMLQARAVYSDERYRDFQDMHYYDITKRFIISSLSDLVALNTEGLGYKILFGESIDLLVNGVNNHELIFDDIKKLNGQRPFTIFNGKKVHLTEDLFIRYKNQRKPLLLVHDDDGNLGIIAAEIFNSLLLKNGEIIYEGFKDFLSKKVYRNVYLCDSNYISLESIVALHDGKLRVRSQSELKSLIKARNNELNFYFAFSINTGSRIFTALQNCYGSVDPQFPITLLLPDIKSKQVVKPKKSITHKYIDLVDIPFTPKARTEAELKANSISSILYQLNKDYGFSKAGLQSRKRNFRLGDTVLIISNAFLNLYPHETIKYSKKRFIEILQDLEFADLNIIKKITAAKIDIVNGKISLNIGKNEYSPKQFYKLFRQAIINKKEVLLSKGLITQEIYENINTLEEFSTTYYTNLYNKEVTRRDLALLLVLDNILREIFGYTGYTLLKSGLLTLTTIGNNIELNCLAPETKLLTRILQLTRFFALFTKSIGFTLADMYLYRTKTFKLEFFASIFLAGHMQSFSVKSNREFLISKLEGLLSANLGNRTTFIQTYYNKFIEMFTRRISSDIIVRGSNLFARKLYKMIYDTIENKSAQIERDFSQTISNLTKNGLSSKDALEIAKELIVEYFRLYYLDHSYISGLKDYDYKNIFHVMLSNNRNRENFKHKIYSDKISNEFMKNFRLPFVVNQYFNKKDILEVEPSLLFTYMTTFDPNHPRGEYRPAWSLSIESVLPVIKKSAIRIFDLLRRVIFNYPDGTGYMTFYFHRPSLSGINTESVLKQSIKKNRDELDGTFITIDKQDSQSILDGVLSAVYYMKKYNAFVILKEGTRMDTTGKTAMCFNELKLYGPEYIVSFLDNPNKELSQTPLSTHSALNYAKWAAKFDEISVLESIHPIYLFHDSQNFGKRLVDLIYLYRGIQCRIIQLQCLGDV